MSSLLFLPFPFHHNAVDLIGLFDDCRHPAAPAPGQWLCRRMSQTGLVDRRFCRISTGCKICANGGANSAALSANDRKRAFSTHLEVLLSSGETTSSYSRHEGGHHVKTDHFLQQTSGSDRVKGSDTWVPVRGSKAPVDACMRPGTSACIGGPSWSKQTLLHQWAARPRGASVLLCKLPGKAGETLVAVILLRRNPKSNPRGTRPAGPIGSLRHGASGDRSGGARARDAAWHSFSPGASGVRAQRLRNRGSCPAAVARSPAAPRLNFSLPAAFGLCRGSHHPAKPTIVTDADLGSRPGKVEQLCEGIGR